MSKRLIATAAVDLAIAASLSVGAARADLLPAQNGGCKRVWQLSKPGGDNMMAGSAHGAS